jgi:hypothetical protein
MMTAREMACKSNQISSGWPCSLLVYRWLDGRNNRNVFSYQSASVVTNRHRKNTKGRRWKDIPQHVTAEFLHRHTASPQIVMQWRQTSNKASKAAILSITTSLLQLLKHFKPKRPHQHTHTHKRQQWVFLNKQTPPSRRPRPPRPPKTKWTPFLPPRPAHKTARSAPRIARNWLAVPWAVPTETLKQQLTSSTRREWR